MISTTSKLSDDLKTKLKNADEIWVAVGLLNEAGLNFILKARPKTCRLNFIVGINLPTAPKALTTLLTLKVKENITASILRDKFFHPKVYIIKSGKNMTAFVGSANCTNGGLNDNIEMTIQTKDNDICKELINWFENYLLPNSHPLTADFIKEYKPIYDNRIKRKVQDKKEISDLKKKENKKLQAEIKYRTRLILKLKRKRRNKNYNEIKQERQFQIKELKKSLDHPRFTKFNFKTFFSKKEGFLRYELGTIPAIRVKASILKNQIKFTKLLKFICDESIPIAKRIDDAMNGELSMDFIKLAFISKVLVTHNPQKYYVQNSLLTKSLKPFGLSFPKGLTVGEEYELTRDKLKEIMNETDITDFATLDQCLW